MKRIFPMVGLAAILMTASACGLLDETAGDCPMVENEDMYLLTFEVDGDTPITDGFYGTVELSNGEEYSFACPLELGDTESPQGADFQCTSSDDADGYDQLRLTGASTPAIVAVTVSTADDTHHFDGPIDLDVQVSSPRCGGNYKAGSDTIRLVEH